MPMRWNFLRSKKGMVVLLFFLLPLFSCTSIRDVISPQTPTPTATPTATPTKTPNPTPTATRIPLEDRNLKEIALQASDLPEGFMEIDLPNLETLFEQMADELGTAAYENLETGFACLFGSQDNQAYANFVLVFSDADYAKVGYDEFIEQSSGDEMDVPLIGEESAGFDQTNSSTTGYLVVWRYQEAILALTYAGEDDVDAEEIIRLAKVIQTRLEEG